MKYLIIATVLCIFVGVSDALWCYKCSGSACETPDTLIDGVYITECDDYTSVCYKQKITHYGEVIYARGCTARKSDCQPLCLGDSDHEMCEMCCDGNLCNNALPMRISLFLLVTTSLIGVMFLRC